MNNDSYIPLTIQNAVIAYTEGADVVVGQWPDETGWSKKFEHKIGACNDWNQSPDSDSLYKLFAAFVDLTTYSGIPPHELHRQLLSVQEYRFFILGRNEHALNEYEDMHSEPREVYEDPQSAWTPPASLGNKA